MTAFLRVDIMTRFFPIPKKQIKTEILTPICSFKISDKSKAEKMARDKFFNQKGLVPLTLGE